MSTGFLTADPMGDEHPSNYLFDRLAAGSVDAQTRARLDEHLGRCDVCRTRRQALEDDRARFVPDAELQRQLAEPRPAPTESRIVPFRPRARMVQALVPVLAAAAALVFLVRSQSGDETATKGGARYEFFIQDEAGIHGAPRGAPAKAGDVVQVTRSGEAVGFVGLFSLDGRGTFTRFVPTDGPLLPAIEAGSRIALPQSVRLDGTPGTEEFVIVECAEAIAVSLATDAARGQGTVPGCVVTRHPLEKR